MIPARMELSDERTADEADIGLSLAPDIDGLAVALSVREVATAMGLSKRTVCRAIQRVEQIAT